MAENKTLRLHLSDDNEILIHDGSGGINLNGNKIELKSASGAKITIGPDGIVLDNGQGAQITLTGAKVDVNGGALEVV